MGDTCGIEENVHLKQMDIDNLNEKLDFEDFVKVLENVLLKKLEWGHEPPFIKRHADIDGEEDSPQDVSAEDSSPGDGIRRNACLLSSGKCKHYEPSETLKQDEDLVAESPSGEAEDELRGLPEAYSAMLDEEYFEKKYTILAVNYKRKKELEERIEMAEETLDRLAVEKSDCKSSLLQQAKEVFARRSELSLQMDAWEKEAAKEKAKIEQQIQSLTQQLTYKKKEYQDLLARVKDYTGETRSCSDILAKFFSSGK